MAKATAHNVDFTNVKDGGTFNTKRIEAGDYLAKIAKVEDAPVKNGENKGRAQYLFTLKLVDLPSSTFPYYCQLTENQLWKLRNILVAAGKSVPKRKQKIDPNIIVGKAIGVSIEDDEYEGKERSTVAGVFPAADLPDSDTEPADSDDEAEEEVEEEVYEEEETEVEEEAEEEADDEEEEAEDDPIDSMNRLELKSAIVALDSDFKARKSQTDDDLRGVLRGLQGGADDEDEEEEEAPTPPAKKKAAPAAKKTSATKKTKAKAKPVEDIDDDELDGLDIDSL